METAFSNDFTSTKMKIWLTPRQINLAIEKGFILTPFGKLNLDSQDKLALKAESGALPIFFTKSMLK